MSSSYNYDKKQLYDFLDENRGYLKWGASRVRSKFAQPQITEDEINTIKSKVRAEKDFYNEDRIEFNDPKLEEAFEEKLESLGLTRDNVKKWKHWDGGDGPKFSIEPHSNYQLNFSNLEDRFLEKFENITTPEIEQPNVNNGEQRQCDVLGLHDAHIDKVVLASETGYDTDDTIEENVETFEQKSLELLQKSKEDGSDTVFIPVGSDFWTVNDDRNTTKRGTKQRVIVPFQESFEVGVEAVIRVIRFAAENFQRVEVPVVYGNHDEDLDFFLGMVLEQAFATTEHVNINKDRIERKYYQFGNNGFMFAHGYHSKRKSDIQKLPSNFSEDTDKSARIWYETRGGIRKAFLADIHHEKSYQHERSEDGIGLSIQFMRSIGSQGKYEWDNGWTGVPKTAYLWRFFEEGDQEQVFKQVWW